MIDLRAELDAGWLAIFERPDGIRRLLAKGIHRRALLWPKPLGPWSPIGLDGDDVLLPVTWRGDLIDIVSFHPDRPYRWRTRRGTATLLGDRAVRWAFHLDRAVHVHATPLDWLQAGRTGAVVLDPTTARFDLATTPKLIVDDEVFAKRLQRMLTAPAPRFEIRLARGAAA